MRILAASLLLCLAAPAAAQSAPATRDPTRQPEGRVSKGGVAPILDMRIQDAGIALPKGLEEQQAGELPKPEAAPEPKPATPQAPPAQPK